MKRILTTIIFLLSFASLFSQVYKPEHYIYGGINEFNSTSSFVFKDSTIDAMHSGTLASIEWIGENIGDVKTRYLTVSSNGGIFTTIKEALDSIIIAGSDTINRWSIAVYPGVYIEDNTTILTLPEGTSINAVSNNTVIVVPQTTGDLFGLSNFTQITGIQVSNVIDGSAIKIDSVGPSIISECIFNSVDTAITVNNATCEPKIRHIYFSNGGKAINKGLNVLAGNVSVIDAQVIEYDTVSIPFYISGQNSIVTLTNAASFSPNVDTFLYATDTARVVMNVGSIARAKNGLFSRNYSQVKYNANSHYLITGSYTDHDATGILGGYANNDDNDAALVIEGQELHVGDAEKGYEVCIGGGDSYSDDMLVYEYNGTTYEDVSIDAKKIDGVGVSFPNVNVNTAIYIASTVSDTLKHYGLKFAMIDSLTIGTGEVVLEYWNGSTWLEFNGMVTDGSAPYAPRAKDYIEQTQSTNIRYNIEMTNDSWGLSDDPGNGTDRKWVRLRIASAITSTGVIDRIKLHSNRFEINDDGFTELFGNARNSQAAALTISQGRTVKGNLTNVTVWSDANIGVATAENNFNSTDDMLGYVLRLADNLDTSSPLSLVMAGRPTATATVNATIRWRIVAPNQTLYLSEPASSGLEYSLVVPINFTEGLSSVTKIKLDVSESIPSRVGGSSDKVWITIQFTTITGDFALTEIGAEYWTWSEGGHY